MVYTVKFSADYKNYEAEIIDWIVKKGDKVNIGDVLFEHQEDKTFEYFESPVSGIINDILVDTGKIIKTGEPVLLIDDGSATPAQLYIADDHKINWDTFFKDRYNENSKNISKNKNYYATQERNKMTPSLRYEIMKRDNFRCQLCGEVASDHLSLHVDHIFPVSKGGKTEESNLRTLCEKCNIGKGAKFDEFGPN
ncbi:MAG: HNH endonuclease [Alkalibacterium sp.]|nr:HNH endonuclease [Alkalibacterium sp.]